MLKDIDSKLNKLKNNNCSNNNSSSKTNLFKMKIKINYS